MNQNKALIAVSFTLHQNGSNLVGITNQKYPYALAEIGTDKINRPTDNLSGSVIAANGIKRELKGFGQVKAFPRGQAQASTSVFGVSH